MTAKDLLNRFPNLQATEPIARAALQHAQLLAANQPASIAVLAAALILADLIAPFLDPQQEVRPHD
ncbi:hypothetical protein [Deefgea salmonis]|uniref:Uncharacterized protein n=1 Tax=Deefgea salmonis TaxID=2875502 RepID=A0ABS8BMA1_9NEIS|nr:hypothetical protein [Deefgea salmonis]MCB5196862.1 hypothetical protein [Deefgea salmonis]